MKTATLGLSWLLYALNSLQIGVLYTSQTPFDVPQVGMLYSSAPHTLVSTLVSTREEIALVKQEILVDFLYSEALSMWTRHCRENGKYVRMWGSAVGDVYVRRWSEYMEKLKFADILLVADTSGTNAQTAGKIHSLYPWLFRDFSLISSDSDLNSALQFVGRNVKSRGIHLVAFFVSPFTALNFLQALELKKLNRPGYAYILSQEAGQYRYLTNTTSGLLGSGVLVVGEEYETEASREALESRKLREILEQIDTFDKDLEAPPTYCLFYTNNSHLVTAAFQPSDIHPSTQMLFPGLSTAIPSSTKASIRASVNYEWINPDLSIYPACKQFMRGYNVAFDEANNRTDLIPDHRLEDYPVSFTGITFDYNFSLSRVQAAQKPFGLIYMGTTMAQTIVGMSQVFTDLT